VSGVAEFVPAAGSEFAGLGEVGAAGVWSEFVGLGELAPAEV